MSQATQILVPLPPVIPSAAEELPPFVDPALHRSADRRMWCAALRIGQLPVTRRPGVRAPDGTEFNWRTAAWPGTFALMKTVEIKSLVERNPFRPFTVRLNNGAQYTFKDARDVGAPKDYHMLFWFGRSEAVRIDADSIVEIFERP